MRKIKLCPRCRKAKLEMYAGWQTGNYICRGCGYIGPLSLEIEKKK